MRCVGSHTAALMAIGPELGRLKGEGGRWRGVMWYH